MDIAEISPENLAAMRFHFQPKGSGPLGMMRILCKFIDAVAKDKGWNLDEVVWENTGMDGSRPAVSYKGMEPHE